MNSLYQQIQPTQILTTPYQISNFQFNTFECISGSNIIILPEYVVAGYSMTIINEDSIAKTIMNGSSTFTILGVNQSIIIVGDSISNLWVIASSISNPFNIIGTSGNLVKTNGTAASGTISLLTPITNLGGLYYYKALITLYTSNYVAGGTSLELCSTKGGSNFPSLISINQNGVNLTFSLQVTDSTHIFYSLPSASGTNTGFRIDIYQYQ